LTHISHRTLEIAMLFGLSGATRSRRMARVGHVFALSAVGALERHFNFTYNLSTPLSSDAASLQKRWRRRALKRLTWTCRQLVAALAPIEWGYDFISHSSLAAIRRAGAEESCGRRCVSNRLLAATLFGDADGRVREPWRGDMRHVERVAKTTRASIVRPGAPPPWHSTCRLGGLRVWRF
jgi:hypothetical protein